MISNNNLENKLSYQHRLQVALIAKTVEKSDDIETIIDGDFSTGSIDDYKQGIALSNSLKLREAAKSLFPLATEFGAEFDNPPRYSDQNLILKLNKSKNAERIRPN